MFLLRKNDKHLAHDQTCGRGAADTKHSRINALYSWQVSVAEHSTKTCYHHKGGNVGSLEEGYYKCGKTGRRTSS
jgi:hypothetical protein